MLGGVPVSRLWPDDPDLADLIVVASTEVNTDEDRAAYAAALKEVLDDGAADHLCVARDAAERG